MSTPKILLGTLAGLAAGVVIGMLIAPEKGATLRKNIIKKGEDLAGSMGEKIDDKLDDILGRVSGKLGRAKKETEGIQGRKQEVDV
jgi:gas vesicle protein